MSAETLSFTGYGQDAGGLRFLDDTGVDLGSPFAGNPVGFANGGLAVLADGKWCGINLETPLSDSPDFKNWGVFAADFSGSLLTGDTGGPNLHSIATDYADKFYSARTPAVVNSQLWEFDNDGTKIAYYDLGLNISGSYAVSVAPDLSCAYTLTVNASVIRKHDLSGGSTTFIDETGDGCFGGTPTCMLCLRDGTLLVGWKKAATAGIVRRYDTDGSVLGTKTLSDTGAIPVCLTPGSADAAYWVSFYGDAATYSEITVQKIQVSDGTVLQDFDPEDGTFQFDGPFAVASAPGDPVARCRVGRQAAQRALSW